MMDFTKSIFKIKQGCDKRSLFGSSFVGNTICAACSNVPESIGRNPL